MKHQEFWQAVARGEAEQWECLSLHPMAKFEPVKLYLTSIFQNPDAWTLRRKPRTIVVNGVECQAGYEGEIADGTEYSFPFPTTPEGFGNGVWKNHSLDNFRRTLVGAYIGPNNQSQAGAVGRAMRLPTETKP